MSKRPTSAERAHMARVAGPPCLVSRNRPVTLHHVTGYADRMGRFSRSHRLEAESVALGILPELREAA